MGYDNPTTIDKLGFTPYVDSIIHLIEETKECELPLTIGIHGAWGSGKTSFMMQLQKRLKESLHDLVPTVWFDAWKYDRVHDVRSALIYKILFELHKNADPGIKQKLTRVTKHFAKISCGIASQTGVSVGLPGAVSLSLPKPKEITAQVNDWRIFQTEVDKFSDRFNSAIIEYLEEKHKKKLIVFIDDLDRCLPENIVVILEALKLFITEAPCVFVVGIDRMVAEKAVNFRYGNSLGFSRDYLNKIIHYPFNIPSAAPYKLRELLERELQSSGADTRCIEIMQLAAQGNPRFFYRLVYSWKLVWSLALKINLSLTSDESKHVLALATALQVRFPEFHEMCRNNIHGLLPFFESCISSVSPSPEEYMQSRNAREFVTFLEEVSIRQFFIDLENTVHIGTKHLAQTQKCKEAINLSAVARNSA